MGYKRFSKKKNNKILLTYISKGKLQHIDSVNKLVRFILLLYIQVS